MIYVIGSINLDLIVTCERLPKAGETVLGKDFSTSAGGKSANQALAASRAGANVTMVGAVGNDGNALLALKQLKKANIDLSNVRTLEQNTGIAMINVADNGENTIIIVAGANDAVSPEMAKATVAKMQQGDILLLAQEIPANTIKAALQAAKQANITSILNIAPFSPETRQLALLADIIIANEVEFAALIESAQSDDIAKNLCTFARQHQKIIIVTLGAKGAYGATANGELIKVDALEIEPIDCVGAGDSFCGYLAAMLEKGKTLKEAMQIASIAGSLACLKAGAQPAIPYTGDVRANI